MTNDQKATEGWIRTCQECGATGLYKSPKEYKSDAWRDAKCRVCKSMGLDYGHPDDRKEPSQ
jgi:hypothetical protein